MNIPEYKTVAGLRSRNGSISKNDIRFCVKNTTADECREYALQLEKLGFAKHTEKEISTGKDSGIVNLCYIYYNDEMCIFIFWNDPLQTLFVTAEPKQPLPEKCEEKSKLEGEAFISQQHIGGGMSYVVKLCDGSFVCVDGGAYKDEDMEQLLKFLKEHSDGAKPRIATWFFTHSHYDHIRLATHFIKNYADEVELEAVAYQFCDCDKVCAEIEDMAKMKEDIEAFENAIETSYPNATVYTLHTGESYYFAGVEVEILRSFDDTYLYNHFSFNDMSAALRFNFANGKTAMLLGDNMRYGCLELAQTYGEYLKSDIMQVAHHGLIGGEKSLYQLIDPDICFWPVNEAVFSGHYGGIYQYCLGEGGCDFNAYIRDDSIRKRTHYHSGKTMIVRI
ncbi:MAG: hypothetical protein IJO96_08010 [Oscillospiraceae bacterium]|nr:hypothetical protein [Oscillospiraceae bacterium]